MEQRITDDWRQHSGGIDFWESLHPHYDAVSNRMILIPETPFEVGAVADRLKQRHDRGRY